MVANASDVASSVNELVQNLIGDISRTAMRTLLDCSIPQFGLRCDRKGNQHHSHFLTLVQRLMINFNFDAHRGADCAL